MVGEPTPGPQVGLVVSIVAYKAAPLTIDCLASIEPECAGLPGLRVFVVDNASPDGAGEAVASAIRDRGWARWATLIRAPANRGFAAGNNEAIRAMRAQHPAAPFLLLLNPDTLVRPGALARLLAFMQDRPEVGIAGGRSEDLDGSPQMCCFRFPSLGSEVLGQLNVGLLDRLFSRWLTRLGVPSEPCPVDWVSGAFMLLRREVVEQLGPMDENYFLYYEETDYCHRAQRAGWSCWHVPDSRVVHLVGQSSGVTTRRQAPRRLPAYWFESRRRYFAMNRGRWYAALTDLALLIVGPIGRLRGWLQRKPSTVPPHFVRDILRHSALWHRDRPASVGFEA
jgi:N-acetylglucosaminyl-diphospho-decaprenol L-rhamnosyltransferase